MIIFKFKPEDIFAFSDVRAQMTAVYRAVHSIGTKDSTIVMPVFSDISSDGRQFTDEERSITDYYCDIKFDNPVLPEQISCDIIFERGGERLFITTRGSCYPDVETVIVAKTFKEYEEFITKALIKFIRARLNSDFDMDCKGCQFAS